MERNERFKAAFNHLRMKGILNSQKDLAESLGATPPHISSAFKGDERYLTNNLLIRFQSRYNGFNLQWLLNGTGEMLNTRNEDDIVLRIRELVELSRMSNEDFAKKIGLDPLDFELKLRGEIDFSDDDLKKLSTILNIRLGWLILGTGQMMTIPNDIKQQVSIDTYRRQKNNDGNEEEIDNSKVLRMLRTELDEIRKIRLSLETTLAEVSGLKMQLQEAIGSMKNL